MNFSILFFTTLFTLIFAGGEFSSVQLFTVSSDQDVNNLGLSSIHEGAGINYFQLGTYAETLTFNKTNGLLYRTQSTGDGQSYNLVASVISNNEDYKGFPYFQLSVTSPNIKWKVDKHHGFNFLDASDNDGNFYAAKNTGDPYRVSQYSYLVGFGDSKVFGTSVSDLKKVQIRIVSV